MRQRCAVQIFHFSTRGRGAVYVKNVGNLHSLYKFAHLSPADASTPHLVVRTVVTNAMFTLAWATDDQATTFTEKSM